MLLSPVRTHQLEISESDRQQLLVALEYSAGQKRGELAAARMMVDLDATHLDQLADRLFTAADGSR